MKRLVLLSIVLAAAAVAVSSCQRGQDSKESETALPPGPIIDGVAVGNRAFQIQGEDSDGKAFKLSDYRGKAVLLDFWAGW